MATNFIPQVSITAYGGDPTGISDSSAALIRAYTALPNGGILFVPTGTYLIAANVTVPENITVVYNGSNFSVAANVTLVIAGPVLGATHDYYGTAAPSTGTYVLGDRLWLTSPMPGGSVGYICTTAGTPGTWKAFGPISA